MRFYQSIQEPTSVSIEESVSSKEETLMFPNPAQNQVTINYYAQKDGVTSVVIRDLFANIKFRLEHNTKQGINTIQINTSSLEEGVYNVVIDSSGDTSSRRLTIIK